MGKAIDDEVLLALAKKGGGGGGGTDDYEDLSHKPQVNGHTLEGNKTTSDLGIKFADLPDAPTIPNDLADLQDDSTHRLVTDTEKATWNGKSDFSGAYNDLTGLPTLGTASSKDVPVTGDASSSQVVMGNDSRLTDSRPASDVPSWAKQSTKPTYTASEVGLGNVPNVSTNDQEPTFTEASTRNNIASGDKLSVIMGKIAKFFNDLKTVAFSGSFSDLTNKPQINSVELSGNKTTSDLGINADNVMLSDGVTSVEDAIDDIHKNHHGTTVNITSYTSTFYTAPSDGYLMLYASPTSSSSAAIVAQIIGSGSGNPIYQTANSVANNSESYQSTYIRKGMKIKIYLNINPDSSNQAKFVPLV